MKAYLELLMEVRLKTKSTSVEVNINIQKMQLEAEKSKYKESSDETTRGDPVTMACYGEGSGSQAR